MRAIVTNPNISMLGRMKIGLRAISQRIADGYRFLSSLITIRSALRVRISPIAIIAFAVIALAACKKGDIYSCPDEVKSWDKVAETHLLRLGHKKPSRKMITTHAAKFRVLNPDVDHPWDACRAWQGGAPLKSPIGPKVKVQVPVEKPCKCKKCKSVSKPSGPISSNTKDMIIKRTRKARKLIEQLGEYLKKVKKTKVKKLFRNLIKELREKNKAVEEAVTEKKTESEAKSLLQKLKEVIQRAKLAMKVHTETTKRVRRSSGNSMKPEKPPDWTK